MGRAVAQLGQQAVQESRNVSVNSNQQPAPWLNFLSLKLPPSSGVTLKTFLKFRDTEVLPPSFLPLYFLPLDFLLNLLKILFIPNSFTPFSYDIMGLCLRAHAKCVSSSSVPKEHNLPRQNLAQTKMVLNPGDH